MEIREIIENKIKAAGITKTEVANRMGIASQNLNSMMSNPTWPTLKRIAAALNMSVSDLVSEETEEDKQEEEFERTTIICPYCGKPIKFIKEEEQ